ncbi:MAG TPA: alanine dehydrogenase [Candidatus Polarisedimenticolia bacterium]|nr:alanine dehydrogenase [Candidatus Polarisedimenticolia bacterium]
MVVGVPREIKDNESRVSLVPAGVRALVEEGHRVLVEAGAGAGSSMQDREFAEAGAAITSADEIFSTADLVVKVKEPQPSEYVKFRPGQILFTYLHLAPLPQLTQALMKSGVTAIAYETMADATGSLPLLTPMSEVAGRMSILVGAFYLQRTSGGRGVLLPGVPGVPPADVVIIGGGVVGTNAAKVALGMGARVVVIEASARRMQYLDDIFGGRVVTLASNRTHVAEALRRTDLCIGAVLVTGARAPHLVSRDMISRMKKGSVVVDVAVDQGGCVETTRATTHTDPVYEVDGVIHYCVANMPAAVPRTSTFALTNATLPYILSLARSGFKDAVLSSPILRNGVNVFAGQVTYRAVAESQGLEYRDLSGLLGGNG